MLYIISIMGVPNNSFASEKYDFSWAPNSYIQKEKKSWKGLIFDLPKI